jgi:hypothetical protein
VIILDMKWSVEGVDYAEKISSVFTHMLEGKA